MAAQGNSGTQEIRAWLTSAAQIGVAGLAIVYAVGFALVQLRLAQIGYIGLGEFRLKYFAAGFLWIAFTVAPFAIGACAVHIVRLGRRGQRPWMLGFALVVFACYTCTMLWEFARMMALLGVPTRLFRDDLILHLAASLVWGALVSHFAYARAPALRTYVRVMAPFLVPGLIVTCLPLYRDLPGGLGGGAGTPALVRLTDSAAVPLQLFHQGDLMPGSPKNGQALSLGCVIVDETPSSYILETMPGAGPVLARGEFIKWRGPRTFAFELPRSRVLSVLYLSWDPNQWPEGVGWELPPVHPSQKPN